MKKEYKAPVARFRNIVLNEKIADICWAYAAGHLNETLYWNANANPGYVSFYFQTKSSCDAATEPQTNSLVITRYSSDFASATAAADAIRALPPANSAEPFKDSPFTTTAPTSN